MRRIVVVLWPGCGRAGGGGGGFSDGLAAKVAEDDVHRDADRPGGELALGVKLREALDDFDQGVLGEVCGGLAIVGGGAEHAEADGVEAVLMRGEELRDGEVIAFAGARDQVAIGRWRAGGAGGV